MTAEQIATLRLSAEIDQEEARLEAMQEALAAIDSGMRDGTIDEASAAAELAAIRAAAARTARRCESIAALVYPLECEIAAKLAAGFIPPDDDDQSF
jgi:hypothetical protein